MTSSERGVTLIELMVSIAVASVVILAAAQAVIVVTQAKRTNQRRLEVAEQANTALALIGFDAQNAGFRFASPVFSVRVLNDVQGNEAEFAPVTATANCGEPGWGLSKGTDTVEFRYGLEDLVPSAGSPTTCVGGVCDVVLGGGSGVLNPFRFVSPAEGANALVLLAGTDAACLGRVSSAVSSPGIEVHMVGLDLTATDETHYPGCADGTFTVMRAARRVRYMICEPPTGALQERPGLFRQEAIDDGDFGTPELVQEGVEDLQIALHYDNADGALAGPGCVGTSCICNRLANDCPDLDLDTDTVDASTGATAQQRMPFRLRGLDVGVTAVSMRTQAPGVDTGALGGFTRPALFDHPAGTAESGNLRHSRESTASLINLVMVVP